MKKILDKFNTYFKVNRRLFLFLIILLIIGIISGSIFSIILKDEDNRLVSEYLNNYLTSISNNKLNLNNSFFSSTISQLTIIILTWLLGFSIIGIPIIFIIYFYKTFIFGFTIGSIIMNYKIKGILLSTVYMFPHQIVKLILLMILIINSFQISFKILNAILKKKEINFKNITTNYIIVLGVTIFSELLLNLYGSYLVPKIIKLILPMIS